MMADCGIFFVLLLLPIITHCQPLSLLLTSSQRHVLPIPSTAQHARLQRQNFSNSVVQRFVWREQTTSCSVTCGLGVAGVTYRCYSPLTGKFALDAKCDPRRRPLTLRRTCKLTDCEPRWEVGPWENCSANCGLGLVQRKVTCVRYGTALPGPAFEEVGDFICNRNGLEKPPDEKPCHHQQCSHWRVSPWSQCSASCGVGVQTRKVRCLRKLPDRHPCDPLLRPQSKRRCNNPDDDCQNKIAMEARNYAQARPELVVKLQPHDLRPRYHAGEWSPCSRTCGSQPGVRYRVVQCRRYFPEMRLDADVSDVECRGQERPASTESCKVQYVPCGKFKDEAKGVEDDFQAFEWVETGFSTCSTSCGGGYRKNLVLCFGITDQDQRVHVDDFRCADKVRPVEKFELCGRDSCQPEWKVTNVSSCSVTCGQGVKFQSSHCIRRQPEIGINEELPEFMCQSYDRPPAVVPCTLGPCSLQWKTSSWSECSETCGIGWQYRNVSCILPIRTGYYEQLPVGICEENVRHHRPPAARRCVTTSKCADNVEILVDRSTHVHFQVNVEIAHFLGGSIYVLPSLNSSLTLICPSPSNATVEWLKDGQPIVPQLVTTSLFHVKPISTANYSCSIRRRQGQSLQLLTSEVVVMPDSETMNVHFGIDSTTRFNWQPIDSRIFDNNEPLLQNKFNILTMVDKTTSFEASFYVSDQCRNNRSCLRMGDNCSIGCAIRRQSESSGVVMTFLPDSICVDLEEAFSVVSKKETAKPPKYPLLPVPFSNACKSKLVPVGWTMAKTGSCDTQRCLSNFEIAVVDLTVRCQPLNRPDFDNRIFLDESYCPLSERPLDYTFCLAPECSKKRR